MNALSPYHHRKLTKWLTWNKVTRLSVVVSWLLNFMSTLINLRIDSHQWPLVTFAWTYRHSFDRIRTLMLIRRFYFSEIQRFWYRLQILRLYQIGLWQLLSVYLSSTLSSIAGYCLIFWFHKNELCSNYLKDPTVTQFELWPRQAAKFNSSVFSISIFEFTKDCVFPNPSG